MTHFTSHYHFKQYAVLPEVSRPLGSGQQTQTSTDIAPESAYESGQWNTANPKYKKKQEIQHEEKVKLELRKNKI